MRGLLVLALAVAVLCTVDAEVILFTPHLGYFVREQLFNKNNKYTSLAKLLKVATLLKSVSLAESDDYAV